jgi:hypothetical protein
MPAFVNRFSSGYSFVTLRCGLVPVLIVFIKRAHSNVALENQSCSLSEDHSVYSTK